MTNGEMAHASNSIHLPVNTDSSPGSMKRNVPRYERRGNLIDAASRMNDTRNTYAIPPRTIPAAFGVDAATAKNTE